MNRQYEIYIDRGDSNGLSQDGCWGGENAQCATAQDGRDLLQFLADLYPDADWVLVNPQGVEVDCIEATVQRAF